MALKALYLGLTLAYLASAHRMCTTCTPLEDLLAPGYGISASAHGLTSGAAYHNGTMSVLSTMVASSEYRALMSTVLAQHSVEQPRSVTVKCPWRSRQWRREPWDKDVPKLMHSYAVRITDIFKNGFGDRSNARPPLDPTAQLLQTQFLALEPFASMSAEARSRVAVAIQIPAWLASSPYACDFQEAAEATFGQAIGLELPSSSAYTTLGCEICRISHEAFECDGPGRLAILEYDGNLATASIIKTPFDHRHTQYCTLRSSSSLELSRWIRSFLLSTTPDMITLAGSHANESTFRDALFLSNATDRIHVHDTIEESGILVTGAAQVAKDFLENPYPDDCEEFEECLDIRAEADEIAGHYIWSNHEKWPASNRRHWRSWKTNPRPRADTFGMVCLPTYDHKEQVMAMHEPGCDINSG